MVDQQKDKKKVLLIDDEQDFCFLVKINLEESGEFEVAVCNDPLVAEEAVRQERPDIILLDNVMPQKDGRQVRTMLNQREDLKGIPVVMVSGRGEMVYIKRHDQFRWYPNTKIVQERGDIPQSKNPQELAELYGVADYVSKPFSTETLLKVIHEVLARGEGNTSTEPSSGE